MFSPRVSQTPQYIADRPGILEEFEEWSRQEASKEDEDTTSIEGGDGEEGEQMEARTTPERDLEQQSIEGGGERRDNGSNSESDDCDDGFNGGSDTNDFHANQRRVAPRRKSARFHNPKPNVPRLQAVWDFLSNEKKWKYVKVGGEYMVAGPDPGSGPVAQSRVRFVTQVISAGPRAPQPRSRCFKVAPVLQPRLSLIQMQSCLLLALL